MIDKETPQSKRRMSISQWVNMGVSALNGAIGDFLTETDNDLQIPMTIFHKGKRLNIGHGYQWGSKENFSRKICIFLHGFGYNERIWTYPEAYNCNYGTLLENDLSYTPFFLRYNTGLHISDNGKELSRLLDEIVRHYPVSLDEIIFIGHSMGGLVIRSACHYGHCDHKSWLPFVSKAIYIASPHHGSFLEKFGHLVFTTMAVIPKSSFQSISKIIDLRSSGIKDLRDGRVAPDEESNHCDDGALMSREPPLLSSISHYLIAGSLTEDLSHPVTYLLGDILVRLPSSTGKGLLFQSPEDTHLSVKIFPGLNHNLLAHHEDVYLWIKENICDCHKA